jgi:hypothetical protein
MWSLFKSTKPLQEPDIQSAIGRLSAMPSNENRIALYHTLKNGRLFLAARNLPPEWGVGPVTLEKATTVQMLTSSAPTGGEALLAFTSDAEVRKRNSSCASFSMSSRDVLALLVKQDFTALVLNPAGPWAGISREDIEKILEGVW